MVFTFPAFLNGTPDFFPGLASPFLDAAEELIFLTFHELQVIVRELRELLF